MARGEETERGDIQILLIVSYAPASHSYNDDTTPCVSMYTDAYEIVQNEWQCDINALFHSFVCKQEKMN